MKILHVISTPRGIGGAEQTMVGLVQAGLARGWDQMVLNPFVDAATDSDLARLTSPARYVGLPLAHVGHLNKLRHELAELIGEFAPDVVHAHLFHASVIAASLLKRDFKLIATHQHGSFYAREGKWIQDGLDGWASRRMDRIVAISNHVAGFLREHHRVPVERIELIPNGWTGQPLPRSTDPLHPTVVAIGNFRPEKGHLVLLDAFKQVLDEFPQARLILAGDGPLVDELKQRAEQLLVTNHVRFVGWVEDIWSLLCNADVYAMPSHSEALGLAAIEAMAAGCPVVASAVGGLPDLIEHERTGLLVAPGDPTALSSAIRRLLKDQDLATNLSGAAVLKADEMKLERITERYVALYELLAGRLAA